MKILISGLQADFSPERLSERMAHFGPVLGVEVVRDGDPDKPWALVEMDLDASAATEVARRIDGIYFIDRFIHARVMLHD